MNGNALEALNGIKKAFASHLVRETSMTFEQALESLNYDTDLQNIEKAIKELEEIKKRAEETLTPIIEREEKFKRLYDASTSKTAFITAEEDKFLQNYFYGDGEKDRETKDLIDYILKGETK
jgi:DNA repair ATPase RecN